MMRDMREGLCRWSPVKSQGGAGRWCMMREAVYERGTACRWLPGRQCSNVVCDERHERRAMQMVTGEESRWCR